MAGLEKMLQNVGGLSSARQVMQVVVSLAILGTALFVILSQGI
jgi:hypothetical protein